MDKEDLFDLIIKGFGVYLLVLAIIAIPKTVVGIFMFVFFTVYNPSSGPSGEISNLAEIFWSSSISDGIGAIIRFVIYIIASISFLRSGALVRKLMGKKNISKEISQDNTD